MHLAKHWFYIGTKIIYNVNSDTLISKLVFTLVNANSYFNYANN